MLGWSDVQAKATSSAHLFISLSSVPLHLPCLSRLVVNTDWPECQQRRESGVFTKEWMGIFSEVENPECWWDFFTEQAGSR